MVMQVLDPAVAVQRDDAEFKATEAGRNGKGLAATVVAKLNGTIWAGHMPFGDAEGRQKAGGEIAAKLGIPLDNTDEMLVELHLGVEGALRQAKKEKKRRQPTPVTANASLLTEVGNAERLRAAHGEDLRYCRASKTWHAYDGRRFALDRTGAVSHLAATVVRDMYGKAAQIDRADEREEAVRWALKSEAARQIEAMVKIASFHPSIAVTPEQFDRDPMLLNAANGTINLQTGQLAPHRRDDLITKLAPVAFDPSAIAPLWDRFIARVFNNDTDLIAYVQKLVGYSLTESAIEQILIILFGLGENGKSTFLTALRDVLGDYAMASPIETFLVKRDGGVSNDVARLRGARFVTAVEPELGKRLAEGLIKSLTGGDPKAARFLYGEFFEFMPLFKLWLAVNHKPVIQGDDHGMWRRIRLIPFTVQIPADEKDPAFGEKLKAEAPGILRWAVQGCLAWQRDGLGSCAAVDEATAGYRREMDVLGDFFDEELAFGAGLEVRASVLQGAYKAWADRYPDRFPPAWQRVAGRLREKGCTDRHTKQGTIWGGVTVTGVERGTL